MKIFSAHAPTSNGAEGVTGAAPLEICCDGPNIELSLGIYRFNDGSGDCTAGRIFHWYWSFSVIEGEVTFPCEEGSSIVVDDTAKLIAWVGSGALRTPTPANGEAHRGLGLTGAQGDKCGPDLSELFLGRPRMSRAGKSALANDVISAIRLESGNLLEKNYSRSRNHDVL